MLGVTRGLRRALPGGFDAVFVINLSWRHDRMKGTLEQLSACGFAEGSVTRYNAVIGRDLDPKKLHACGFLSRTAVRRLKRPEEQRVWGMDMTPGGLGCALSHVDLWCEIAARAYSRVLVLEDDCLIPPTFVSDYEAAWQRVERHPVVGKQWGLVYVSGLDTDNTANKLEIAPGLRLVPQMHRTTNAYVINAAGARDLLSLCVPLTFQLDTEMTTRLSSDAGNGVPAVTAFPCFSLHPNLIVQATRFGSDIQASVTHDTTDEERSRCLAAGWTDVPTL